MARSVNPQRDRAASADRAGRRLWRGLEELADAPDFRQMLEREFPALTAVNPTLGRREALKLMGASFALAGLAGCDGEPDEHAIPYVEAPEFIVPGEAKHYATATVMGGYAQPVIGETHVGRPTKLEGNPEHPASLGATDAFTQAAVLGLYDPERSRSPRYLGRAASWNSLESALVSAAARLDATGGAGFRLLTGASTSPTLARQIDEMMRAWPKARWHMFEPVSQDLRLEATRLAFGRPLDRHLRLDEAAVVVALDDDLLGPGPFQTHHGRMWAARRMAFQEGEAESRLLVAEPTPSLTGVRAGRRHSVRPERIGGILAAIAAELGVGAAPTALPDADRAFAAEAAEGLDRHRGRGLLTVGAEYATEAQALALAVNERLGNLGRTIVFTEPVRALPPDGARSLEVLAEDMAEGRVSALAILDANPVYTTPAGIDFGALMDRVEFKVHAGMHFNETAAHADWHLPLLHELDSWSDARAVNGLATVIQPLVRPFFGGRSRHVAMELLRGNLNTADYDIVRRTWAEAFGDTFEERWAEALLRGFVADSAPAVVETGEVRPVSAAEPAEAPEGLTAVFRPDPCVWDGSFTTNAWLQETPKPLTKVTWDNVVMVAPALADELGLENGNAVEVEVAGRHVTGPVWAMPGQDRHTVALFLGYGRGFAGEIAEGLGYDAYQVRPAERPWQASGVRLRPAGFDWALANTQLHFAMEGFDFVRTVTPEELHGPDPRQKEEVSRHGEQKRPPTLYPHYEYESPSWGMSIDLDLCIGCNACVVACVAENNIPVVGKEQVGMGREMHWLRVDRYYEGDAHDPSMYFQPVPCMHCEKAPCEMGCPVNATVHSPDGLNLQIYNRCIGTRTCSSYCPYKVRRFNWYDYTNDEPEPVHAVRNPEVTVRSRGVMEKCTYCIQRISTARIEAKTEERPIRDGEVMTACQQACPTQAIVFGDISDPDTKVSRRKASERDYSLLEEVNTWPRTTYLSRVERPHEPQKRGKEKKKA